MILRARGFFRGFLSRCLHKGKNMVQFFLLAAVGISRAAGKNNTYQGDYDV